MEKGIDVSRHQMAIDFHAVKEQGFSFVMIKAGGADDGYYKDRCFEQFYKDAVNAGLHVGAYYFTSQDFYTENNGIAEARHFLTLIDGKKFDYPVAVDVEAVSPIHGKNGITKATIAFCRVMEEAGYYVTVYASDYSGFVMRLNLNELSAYDKWVARYNTKGPLIVSQYGMWQYGGSTNYICNAKVEGVASSACDQNYSYLDYPSIITRAKLNGYGSQPAYYDFSVQNITIGDANALAEKAKELELKFIIKEKD